METDEALQARVEILMAEARRIKSILAVRAARSRGVLIGRKPLVLSPDIVARIKSLRGRKSLTEIAREISEAFGISVSRDRCFRVLKAA